MRACEAAIRFAWLWTPGLGNCVCETCTAIRQAHPEAVSITAAPPEPRLREMCERHPLHPAGTCPACMHERRL